MRLLLSTGNSHKISEISAMLKGLAVQLALPKDFPQFPQVEEDQPTIEGNAGKKAVVAAKACGLWTLADDTGLEVAALGGAPGVFSARYAGPDCDFDANIRKLLLELANVPPPRRAAFRTVMALSDPQGNVLSEEGRLEGEIVSKPQGGAGFGYDPVFYVPAAGKTLAEMSFEEKNAVSHRGQALSRIMPRIKTALGLLCVCIFLALPARADRTEPAPDTIWDQIMAAQANRDLQIGYDYMNQRQYDAAVKEFTRAVAASPRSASAHMMLGAAYYWNGQVDRSLDEYHLSLGLDPNSAQTYILMGISLAYQGKTQDAYASFLKASDIDPTRPDTQMDLASLEESLGKISDALDHLRKAVSLSAKDPLYRFQLGALYYLLGRDQDAADALNAALGLDPNFEDALIELGAVQEREGQMQEALRSFNRAVDLKSRDSVARLRLGRIYLFSGNSKKAEQVFAGAFHLTPKEGGPGLQLNVSYSGQKQPTAGDNQEEPKSPKPNQPDSAAPPPSSDDPLSVFARNLQRIPLDQSAIMEVDVVFVPKPSLVKAADEESSSLKSALQQAMSQPSASPQIVRRQFEIKAGNAEERAQQIAQVISNLRQSVQKAPPNSDIRLGMNLTFKNLQASGGSSGAGSSQEDDKSNVFYEPRQVGNDMGLWIVGVGWMALVEETLPQAGEAPNHPDKSDWWVATGLADAALGKGDDALAAFDRAVNLDPNNESAFLGRGVAQVITGDEKAAVASYQRALKINPKDKAAQEGLEWLLRPLTGKKTADAGEKP